MRRLGARRCGGLSPTSAAESARASLMPSPTMATLPPAALLQRAELRRFGFWRHTGPVL